MSDKPKLTLETALAEFPQECKMLGRFAREDWSNYTCSAYVGWHMLVGAALRWLAGKKTSGPPSYLFPHHRAIGSRHSWHWPDDPLRWLLGEVGEQPKQEKEG